MVSSLRLCIDGTSLLVGWGSSQLFSIHPLDFSWTESGGHLSPWLNLCCWWSLKVCMKNHGMVVVRILIGFHHNRYRGGGSHPYSCMYRLY